MSEPRARAHDATDFLRSLPIMLTALVAVVFAVDLLLAFQPAVLDDLSRGWRRAVSALPVSAPAVSVLAASLAVGCVVLSSAVLLMFSRAVASAPHMSLAPAWVALCMLSVVRVDGRLPLPTSLPLFAALSALLCVGAGVALCSASRPGLIFGWVLLAAPLVVLGIGYASVATGAYPVGRETAVLVAGLLSSASGVVLLSYMHRRARPATSEIPDLDGVDVVEELFTQIERAERSEARVAELERQLNAQAPKIAPPQPPPVRRTR